LDRVQLNKLFPRLTRCFGLPPERMIARGALELAGWQTAKSILRPVRDLIRHLALAASNAEQFIERAWVIRAAPDSNR
jgi:hypothetical protein